MMRSYPTRLLNVLGLCLFWLVTVLPSYSSPIVATNVTTTLGPHFLFDEASTGGGDNFSVVFARDISGYWTSNSTVTLKGLGWASDSAGTVATNATVTFTDLGPDGVFGTGDDMLVGTVSDQLLFEGAASEFAWGFDSNIVFQATGSWLRIQIQGFRNGAPAVISRKTTSGSSPANVKLSLVGDAVSSEPPLSYSLVSGNESWPAAKRAAIISAMDEAVAHCNAYGWFPKQLTVNYDTNVPTANANYNGRINFGGQIATRTAIHEISHTLGVGTVGAWSSLRVGDTWSGPHANARMQLYEGAGATIGCDAQHFWLYGLNFPNEDGYLPRIRHARIVAALRWDMGIVTDADADGLPDDWERFYLRTLTYNGSDDFDHDGSNNLAEYNADTDPRDGISALTTILVVNNASAAGQSAFNFGPATLSAFFGASTVTPNALLNNNPAYLGVNSSSIPTDDNVNAINDRDGVVGGADQERLRIAIQPRHGLAQLTWHWSRADGPLTTDGVTISGFSRDPEAAFSGGIGAVNPIYSTGKLTFQISAFDSTVHTITFANPAASYNAILEITVADSTQAGPQLALRSLSFMDLNSPPVAMPIPLSAPLGGFATAEVIGGAYAPKDPDGDALIVTGVGAAGDGVTGFTSTNVTYTSTNVAASDTFSYVVSDSFGGYATNDVMVSLVPPAGFHRLSSPTDHGNGTFTVNYLGISGNSYALYIATDLTPPINWLPLVTNAVDGSGAVEFLVTPGSSQGFFRARAVP